MKSVVQYESKFGGGKQTAAQHLAELMVGRQASLSNRHLPDKFWNTEEWKRSFRLQIRYASGLLKLYHPTCIFRALKSAEGRKMFSLGNKHLDTLIKREQAKFEREQRVLAEQPPVAAPVVTDEPPRPAFVPKKNLASRLRDLNG